VGAAELPEHHDAARTFRAAVADDLALLARLHRQEVDGELLGSLRELGFPDALGLRLQGVQGRSALQAMREAMERLPQPVGNEHLDRLAADFADIYLNHRLRAAPNESVWLDDDGLMMQEPMFQVRDWYRRYGVAAEDWRRFPDDHLTLQLQFIGHLFQRNELAAAAQFMDEHLLRWLTDFAVRVANRSGTDFYAGVAVLTGAYLEELRDLLAELLEQPRPSPEEIADRMKQRKTQEQEAPYLPGAAPSW
jgi:putative dimethyl sulfoxide reductase chaperone